MQIDASPNFSPSPRCSRADFEPSQIATTDLKRIWDMLGPTMERNKDAMPLQTLLCVAFIEGVQHCGAYFALREGRSASANKD